MTPKANPVSLRLSLAVGLMVALAPTAAHAASGAFEQGTMMVGAERLFGLSVGRVTQSSGDTDSSVDQTHFGLFMAASSPLAHVYMVPRLAFDFSLTEGLTLGGALGFVISDYGTSTSNGNNTVDRSGPTQATFLLAPRVGYALGLGRILSLWLRGGITYFNAAVHSEDTPVVTNRVDRLWGIGLNLEPTLLVVPVPHFGFTVSALIDLPLAGRQSQERTVGGVTTTTSIDTTVRNFGVMAGLIGLF